MALRKDERGLSQVAVIMFILAFVILTAVVVTYFQVVATHDEVTTALNRSANAAIQLATPDDYRREAEMYLDTAAAEAEFQNQLTTYMHLDATGTCHGADGRILYRVTIASIQSEATTARMTVTGTISVPVAFFKTILGERYIETPFRVTSRNQRLD